MNETATREQAAPRTAKQTTQPQPAQPHTWAAQRPPEKPGFTLALGRRSGWYYRQVR